MALTMDCCTRHAGYLRAICLYRSVKLDDWPRHRKAVVAPFNDDLMSLVWRETLCHTR